MTFNDYLSTISKENAEVLKKSEITKEKFESETLEILAKEYQRRVEMIKCESELLFDLVVESIRDKYLYNEDLNHEKDICSYKRYILLELYNYYFCEFSGDGKKYFKVDKSIITENFKKDVMYSPHYLYINHKGLQFREKFGIHSLDKYVCKEYENKLKEMLC